MKQLAALVLAATVASTGCAGTISNSNTIKISGPGPAIAGGAGLVLLGGALAYKTQTDDMNEYNTDGLVTGIGVGLVAAGVISIAYGAYQLSAENGK